MAAIIGPKFKISSVTKTSTLDWDKSNGGYAKYQVTAEVTFNLYTDNLTNPEQELTKEALKKLGSALAGREGD